MPTYIAMLRGVNVGPHKRMKMEKLRACCQKLGFADVKTYIQSGNIVVRAAKSSEATVASRISGGILSQFGFSVEVIARSLEDFREVVERNPLLKERGLDPAKFHVVFLGEKPSPASLERLKQLTLPPDQMRHSGREIYFYFPNGVSGSSLWKHPLDRILGLASTMRNWNTVNALCKMAAEIA